jgi:hypothetical protein
LVAAYLVEGMENGSGERVAVSARRLQGPETETLRRFNARQAERDKWHLNASELAQLQGLRGDHYDRAANWISNLLCYGYGICRPPLTGGSEGAPKSRRITHTGAAENGHEFVTAPNPAENWVTFRYRFSELPDRAMVVVRDPIGREVVTMAMNGDRGQLVLDTRELAKGCYTITYTSNGKVDQVDRLIVQ